MRDFMKKKGFPVLLAALAMVLLPGCSRSGEGAAPSVQETAATVVTEPARQQREGLQTLLVVCLDTFEAPRDSGSYRTGNRADLIMVMILDEQQGKTTALQLNPDTVVSFSAPGLTESLEEPLGLVYSYGSGGSDSCLNGSKAVSRLLGGVSIDHYMTFTADSIAIVNDMLGGVTVPVTEEIPGLDTGDSVTLMGENAIAFFRFRDDGDTANEAHMERQRQYMTGMFGPFMEKAQQEEFLSRLTLQLGDGMSTDLTLSQMMQLLQTMGTYELDQTIVTIPGTAEKTEGEFRFRVDSEALEQTVESLFFAE